MAISRNCFSFLGYGVFIAAAPAAFLACGNPTANPVGFDGPERPLHRKVVYPADTDWRDSYYDIFVPTGRHYRLAVGSWGEEGNRFRSRVLLHYDLGDIPKLIPVAKITAVYLELSYFRVSGYLNDDVYSYGDVMLEARPLRRRFDEDRATWWQATRKENWTTEGGDLGPVVATAVVGDPSYQRRYVRMDITGLALDWISNPHRNYGLALKAAAEDNAPGIKEFYSTNEAVGGNAPRLEIVYIDDDGEKAYRIVAASKDCFITDYDGAFRGGERHGRDEYLSFGSFNGYGRRVVLYFDLSPAATGIPADASIARARLRLFYDPAGRDERVYVAVYRLLAAFDEDAAQATLSLQRYHDNVAYVDREFKKEPPGYVDIYINPLVQEWVSGKYPNYGLMIKAPDESAAQAFPRFGAQDNGEADRRPYLEIEYTRPAEPWFREEP